MERIGRDAEGCKLFINVFLCIQEPRETDDLWSVLPYLLRDFQETTVDYIVAHILGLPDPDETTCEGPSDLLIDKTREMGVTWLFCAVFLWFWLFRPGSVLTASSMTEEKIDSQGDPSCIMYKFDFLYNSLKVTAPYLWSQSYDRKEFNQHRKRINPDGKGSILRGEVMGPNLGRSGRGLAILLDEFAEASHPAEAWAAAAFAAPCRFPVFTPRGLNFAGRLAVPPKGQPRTIKRLTLHWMNDYTKNRWVFTAPNGSVLEEGHGECPKHIRAKYNAEPFYPWYFQACRRVNFDPVRIAQEINVDYSLSGSGYMYPQVYQARRIPLKYNPSWPLYLAMDFGLVDEMYLVWVQWSPLDGRFKWLRCFHGTGHIIEWYVPIITGASLHLGQSSGGYTREELRFIDESAKFRGRYAGYYGDPDGKKRNPVDGRSIVQVLRGHGIDMVSKHRENDYLSRQHALAAVLLHSDMDPDGCADLIQSIEDSKLGPGGTPVHDGNSHGRTAAEFFAVNQSHGITGTEATAISDQVQLAAVRDGSISPDELNLKDPSAYLRSLRAEISAGIRYDSRNRGVTGRRGGIRRGR